MIKITLEFTSMAAAITALATMRQAEEGGAAAPAVAKADTPKPVKSTEKPAADKPTAAAVKADAPEASASASAPDYDKVVGPAISSAAKTHKPAVVALLAEFGAKNGKELKATDYAAFMEKLTEATTETELG